MKQTYVRLLTAGSVLACAAAMRMSAQAPATATTTAPASSDAASSTSDVTTLEKFTVSDVPLAEQVLPTVRPISSVYGDDMSIIDTPRAVVSVNKAWMDDRMVKNAMDFGQFAPGVYSAAEYGIPGVPQIRGDLGQVYVNGQLTLFSRNSTPMSFNGVEAMDIVKGPGSAVYGPQGEGAGGYVNFVNKEPYFDRQHVDISATFGYWTSGHSYSNPSVTIDFGGPLSDKLAYRVSYLERWGDEYYLNAKDETQDLYAALTYLFTKETRLDVWAQMYSDRTNEITGTNRVTQQFIDNGTYIAGPTSPVTSGPYAYYGIDIVTDKGVAPGAEYGSYGDGSYVTVDPSTAHAVKLPGYDALVGPEDTARAKLFQTQFKLTTQLTPDSSITDLFYDALGQSDKYETYGYDEYVPRSESIQNRLEFHSKFDTGTISHSVVTGLDFRYTEVISYDDYTTEPFGYYDLSQPLQNVFYPGYYLENETWGGGMQVPGKPGYSTGTEMQDSNIYDTALFFQDNVKLTSKFSTILGIREDNIKADTANPPFVLAGLSGPFADYEGYYPLASPVMYKKGDLYTGDTHKIDPSYFVSFVYKITDTQSAYITYDRVEAILGTSNFGGLHASSFDSGTIQSQLNDSITTAGTLYEAGYKGSYLNNTLYGDIAFFQQLKLGAQLGGPDYLIKDNGIEAELVYQPSKAMTINTNFTYQDATGFGDSFFQESGNYLDLYDPATVVDGQHGTGFGATNYTSYDPPTGRMRAPGVPQFIANVFVDYKFPNGFGLGAGPQLIGKQYANDQDTLHIPTEYEVDGYLYYRTKNWDVRLNITNLFNQRLLDPIDVSFAGNDTVFVRKPISASITFRLHL